MGIEQPVSPERDRSAIAQEVRVYGATTTQVARLTASYIQRSWRGEGGDSELMALRHALITDERVGKTLSGSFSGLPLSPEERYQLYAAGLTAQHTIPFTQEERESLRHATGSWDESPNVWERRATSDDKHLLEAWTAWLEEGKVSPHKVDTFYANEAAILERACQGLADVLGRVLE